MSKRKTSKEYITEVAKINDNIEIIDDYINAQTKILHLCKICGWMWDARPHDILHGKGCPKCARNIKKTHEEYVEELTEKCPDIKVIGDYINIATPVLHCCKICDHQWIVRPNSILSGCGCPNCRNIKLRKQRAKTTIQYKEELESLHININVIGEYINNKTSILHKCAICGHEWFVKPDNILHNQGCPKCNQSHGEKLISKWLLNHNIPFIPQYRFIGCKDKRELPFDFYVSQFNLCIEFDGIQHFEPIDFSGKGEEQAIQNFKITQYHDSIKNNFCKTNNIILLRIRYDEDVTQVLNDFLTTQTIQND